MPANTASRRHFLKLAGWMGSASLLPAMAMDRPKTADRRLGVALVGLGMYSEGRLAPALQLTRHCRLAGLVSGSPGKLRQWQAKYAIADANIYDYDNFDRIVDNPDIDVVYVVLPNHLHKPFTIAAANAGKHVWCEKPMAMNAAEAQDMIAACQRNRVSLSIGYRLQHEPNTQRIIGFARDQPYGRIESIIAQAGFHAFDGQGPENWRLDPARGGGAMYDMGVYALNGARYTTGEEPIAVTARQEITRKDVFRGGVDESMYFTLEFPSGCVAECATSFGKNMNHLRADCANGWYELQPFQTYDGIHGRTSDGMVLDATVTHQQALQMDNDALAILHGTPLRVPGEEGLRDMRVLDAIFASARLGKRVEIHPRQV